MHNQININIRNLISYLYNECAIIFIVVLFYYYLKITQLGGGDHMELKMLNLEEKSIYLNTRNSETCPIEQVTVRAN